MPDRATIRGYGGLFRRDWRIYSIPDGRGGRRPLPVHGGVPMRAVGYFAAVAAALFVASRLPLVGLLLEPLGAVTRYVALPGAAAFLLTRLEPEDRQATRYLASLAAHRVWPRCHSAGRRVLRAGERAEAPMRVALAPDANGSSLVGCRVRGPARIAFRDVVALIPSRRRPTVRGAGTARPGELLTRAVDVAPGEVIEVRT
jgi:hypothetical protein